MAKVTIAQPSLSPSQTKLIKPKLLVAQAEQKAKGEKISKTSVKATVKATKAPAKARKAATKAAIPGDKEDSQVQIVEDDTFIKCVCYIFWPLLCC